MVEPQPHAPAYPHDAVEAIGDDVFAVRGSLLMGPLLRISRNMAVVRHAGELSLINPIRLNDHGIAALQQLGRIKRIVTLGALHGIDDAWYRQQFGVECWTRPGSRRYPPPAGYHRLDESTPLPFPDARVFCFNGTQPESAILLTRGAGLLLTCDAIQHYGDYRHASTAARLLLLEDGRLWRGQRPAAVVASASARRAELAADLIVQWMESGRMPDGGPHVVRLGPQDVELML